MSDLPYAERLKRVKLTTLRSRRLRGDMIECWKLLHGEYDAEASPSLPLQAEQRPHATNLREHHPLHLLPRRGDKVRRRTYFTHRVVPVWNSLGPEVKAAFLLNAFKNRLDKQWENDDFLFDPALDFPHGVIVRGVTT